MDELFQARIDTVTELSEEYLNATARILKIHGSDPLQAQIVTAALTRVILTLDKITPGFSEVMIEMIKPMDKCDDKT